MELFEGLTIPSWAPADVDRFWRDVVRLTSLQGDDLVDALDDLTQEADIPSWALLVVFNTAWNIVLQSAPRELRRLTLSYEYIERRAEDDAISYSARALRSTCRYLSEIIDDDLNWSGFRLPGES